MKQTGMRVPQDLLAEGFCSWSDKVAFTGGQSALVGGSTANVLWTTFAEQVGCRHWRIVSASWRGIGLW